jgi:hypothetical protein
LHRVLDFDGVTHPEPCKVVNYFCHLPLIEVVLREYPAVDIVISSSWRDPELHYLDELRGFLSPDIGARVVGVTPSIKTPSSTWLPSTAIAHEREWKCQAWMKANRPWGTPWLAIDDRASWFGPDCSELLLTDKAFGFSPDDQATLRRMLQVMQ